MNGETLLTASHAWQDPRSFHTSWTYNDTFLNPQAYAPGAHAVHNFCNGIHHVPRESFAMPSYGPQYPPHEFWNSVGPFQPHHGQFVGNSQSMPQQYPGHGIVPPLQSYANGSNGYAVSSNQGARPAPQIAQYGYRSYQQTPLSLHVGHGPARATINNHNSLVSACDHCSSTVLSSPQTVRSAQMPIAPASPTLARGPPRKPRRSGHAVWVGNIPMGASIEALKDHFSHEATRDIESVFLMAKSNCAFVNYDTEDACVAAVERFNHSLFGSVRLLCRMRREPAAQRETSRSSGTSLQGDSPAGSFTDDSSQVTSACDSLVTGLNGLGIQHDNDTKTEGAAEDESTPADSISPSPRDRYFVVKSLTKEDLHNSLQHGTWETQSHNQRGFDNAFREAENVYMIFSVNKSGEYFGYARMVSSPLSQSPIQSAADVSNTPVKQNDTLKITQTAATATAPAGYIIDDTIRGTLFWEAQHEDNGIVSSTMSALDRAEQEGHVRSRPFRVEWLSVRRVTFQRTKGIRNPWNNNKEVKVARDGTELETETGKKIVALFHESYEDMIRKGQ